MNERINYSACPLCESLNIQERMRAKSTKHPLYHASLSPEMVWMDCPDCGHVFTKGYFTSEALDLIFSKTHASQSVGGEVEKNRSVSAQMIEKVLPYANEGLWLDVGVGNGSLLFTAQEYGFDVVGTDLRVHTVQQMNKLGIKCYAQDFVEVELPQKCAVISMADVLEHIPFPKVALQGAHAKLRDKGVLFLSMPNMESMIWKLKDKVQQNLYWAELEHYHNFSRTRLYALLRACGFEPVRYGISERYSACMEVIALKV